MMLTLADSFGRQFKYLRLSVTDMCNFRCVYCLPHGYTKPVGEKEPLSLEEIQNLVAAFAQLGFDKVRITGGEPTLRRDIVAIAQVVAQSTGIKKVALSTNGYKLLELAKPLQDAGVSALNVSLDSLDEEKFRKITGKSNLKDILAGIDLAIALGFASVKVNAVLLKDMNSGDVDRFIDWVKVMPVSVRFIELMRTGSNRDLFNQCHVSGDTVTQKLLSAGWQITPREPNAGPAVEFSHAEYMGRIGVIAPYSKDFCTSCNRLRVTSQGALKLCLFGDKDYSLRPLLQNKSQLPELIDCIQSTLGYKTSTHLLHDGNYGNTTNFAIIGG